MPRYEQQQLMALTHNLYYSGYMSEEEARLMIYDQKQASVKY